MRLPFYAMLPEKKTYIGVGFMICNKLVQDKPNMCSSKQMINSKRVISEFMFLLCGDVGRGSGQ